jgi:hypothetical protein
MPKIKTVNYTIKRGRVAFSRYPNLNVKLLRKIQTHILESPNRLMMGDIISYYPPGTSLQEGRVTYTVPSCGTVACIAGWALVLTGTKGDFHLNTAAKLLGIPYEDELFGGIPYEDEWFGSDLFFVSRWPEKFKRGWKKAKTPKGRARITVRCIDYFIKMYELEGAVSNE